MKIVDLHCDALLKLLEKKERVYTHSEDIQTNYERLVEGGVTTQVFALFTEPYLKNDEKFTAVEKQLQLFEQLIKQHPRMKQIKQWEDLSKLNENEIGAILSLEGTEPIGNDINRYLYLLEKGVKSVGLTWNLANLCADGVMEKRGAGLTEFGKDIVDINNKKGILTDVSHLSEKGFWDVIETAFYPIATHSNAKAITSHPRNLTNEQIQALIEKNTVIGVVFYPMFVTGKDSGSVTDLLKHIDHICSLGGAKHIAFGSDFDGIPTTLTNLEHAGCYPYLIEELLVHFDEETVKGFASQNFKNVIKTYFLHKDKDIT